MMATVQMTMRYLSLFVLELLLLQLLLLQVPTRDSLMRQADLMVNAKQGMKKGRRRN